MSSENTRRSARLQNKREKFLLKRFGKRKKCRIADDSDSRSDSPENLSDDCEAAINTSFSKHEPRYEIGSRGGNFTRV